MVRRSTIAAASGAEVESRRPGSRRNATAAAAGSSAFVAHGTDDKGNEEQHTTTGTEANDGKVRPSL